MRTWSSLLLTLLLSLFASTPARAAHLFAGVAEVEITDRAAGKFTFVAGYTNGYLYYLPTAAQRQIPGYAQEDSDCLVGPPGWRKIFGERADAVFEQRAK